MGTFSPSVSHAIDSFVIDFMPLQAQRCCYHSITIFVAVFTFLVERVAGLLNIISGILFLGAVVTFLQYFFGWPYGEAGTTYALTAAITATVFAFLLSPYGLPTAMVWILEKLDGVNNAIKAI